MKIFVKKRCIGFRKIWLKIIEFLPENFPVPVISWLIYELCELYILDKEQQLRCALPMMHVNNWNLMSKRKIPPSLILEDDAIFVSYFKQKWISIIYSVFHYGILCINATCLRPKTKSVSDDCYWNMFNLHSQHFQNHLSNTPPLLTTYKLDASRKNDFVPPDIIQHHFFRLSLTLQSFLLYQGFENLWMTNL